MIDWETPPSVFDPLNLEFGFNLDVCAQPHNAKVPQFYSPTENALHKLWKGVCWMNPPYGRDIDHWIRKAYESSLLGTTMVCLLPSKTDTAWWHDYCLKGEIRWIRGRVHFVGGTRPRFASVIVIFRPPICLDREAS